ncbi:hypothetical protein D3C79_834300 [compost metagenome]
MLLETPADPLQAGARQYAVRVEPATADEGHAPVIALLAETGGRQQHLVVLAVDAAAAGHHLADVPLQQAEGELQLGQSRLLLLGHLVAGEHPLQHLIGAHAQAGEDGDGHQHLQQGETALTRRARDHGYRAALVHRLI